MWQQNNKHPALCPGLPRWAGSRKVKPIWILLKQETESGSAISCAICKSAPRSRQTTTPAPHHSVFTGRMPFLQPNQQRRSTEGTKQYCVSVTVSGETCRLLSMKPILASSSVFLSAVLFNSSICSSCTQQQHKVHNYILCSHSITFKLCTFSSHSNSSNFLTAFSLNTNLSESPCLTDDFVTDKSFR